MRGTRAVGTLSSQLADAAQELHRQLAVHDTVVESIAACYSSASPRLPYAHDRTHRRSCAAEDRHSGTLITGDELIALKHARVGDAERAAR
jgi:hypothetical protein